MPDIQMFNITAYFGFTHSHFIIEFSKKCWAKKNNCPTYPATMSLHIELLED